MPFFRTFIVRHYTMAWVPQRGVVFGLVPPTVSVKPSRPITPEPIVLTSELLRLLLLLSIKRRLCRYLHNCVG